MITDEMIKTEFISQIVTRDINIIYETQNQVVKEMFPNGSGHLAQYLARKPFDMTGSGLERTFFMKIFSYLRFLDIQYRKDQMRTRSKLSLYNRVIWGVLYNETMPDIRYGFTSEIRKKIISDLQKADPSE